jgi:hypothetical protein
LTGATAVTVGLVKNFKFETSSSLSASDLNATVTEIRVLWDLKSHFKPLKELTAFVKELILKKFKLKLEQALALGPGSPVAAMATQALWRQAPPGASKDC